MNRVNDDILISKYLELGNVWKVGDILGMSGQQVYSRLNKLGIVKHKNYWTEKDDSVLKEKYIPYKIQNRLDVLAKELGRTKQFICRKAKNLGLTDKSFLVVAPYMRERISESTKKYIKENGHPRGFLGHKHSESAKKKMSDASKRNWKKTDSPLNSERMRQLRSDNLHNRKINDTIKVFSNRGDHISNIGGLNYVFKSTWEVKIAEMLEKMKNEGLIKSWQYEGKHFVFNDIKRGIRSYCPDFMVEFTSGNCVFIEVKGWKMEKSMKRIEMFKERYPNEKFYLIDNDEYNKILSQSDYLWRRCVEIQSIQNC